MRIMIKFLQIVMMFLLPVLVYIVAAFVLALFPQASASMDERKYPIYLYHDEHVFSHTEVILPIAPLSQSFVTAFPSLLQSHPRGYIAFSYGDAGFMMDRGGFEELNLTLALKALFVNTSGLIKVGHYEGIVKEKCEKIVLDLETLQRLKAQILQSFVHKEGQCVRVHDVYGLYYVSYFKAKEPYNLFHTCNTWSGDRLREAGLKMPYWTPFAQSVIGYNHRD